MDSNTCKTCRYWRYGECEAVDIEYSRKLKTDGRLTFVVLADATDDSGLTARLMTGPDFGCIKHTAKGDQ